MFRRQSFSPAFRFWSSPPKRIGPPEDQGYILRPAKHLHLTPRLQQKLLYSKQVYDAFGGNTREMGQASFQIEAPGNSIGGYGFKPWDQRKRTVTGDFQRLLSAEYQQNRRLSRRHHYPRRRCRAARLSCAVVLKSTKPFDQLAEVSYALWRKRRRAAWFMFLDNDLKVDKPQAVVDIDRDKAAHSASP